MILKVKNKETLIIDEFRFKCSIGKNGFKKKKYEGDGSTPTGLFGIGKLYWRKDRVRKPETKISCKVIKKDMIWCDDPNNNYYNKETKIKNVKGEKLFRKDYRYNYFLVIQYNTKKIIKNKGSAIFLHLTKNYKKTQGCIAVSEKDFLIIAKLISRNSKIKIN